MRLNMKNTLRTESIGNTYVIEVDFKDRVLTGILERLTGPDLYRVWIPGVCNITMNRIYPGYWSICKGMGIIDDLTQCIGEYLEHLT